MDFGYELWGGLAWKANDENDVRNRALAADFVQIQ